MNNGANVGSGHECLQWQSARHTLPLPNMPPVTLNAFNNTALSLPCRCPGCSCLAGTRARRFWLAL